MAEKKRNRPSTKTTIHQTKRQRHQKPDHHHHNTAKPIPHQTTPLESLLPQQRIDLIATLSESILEDPTSAVSSSRTTTTNNDASENEEQYTKTPSKLATLLSLASPSTNGYDAHAARLAILSLLVIYQDILPAYRIRLPTESELAVRVSKEIKATWDYERRLLQGYQRYLQLLERTWGDGRYGNNFEKKKGSPTTLAATAMLSLSQLLMTCYNFNFRSNLIQIVVREGNCGCEEIRGACCKALSVMFERDVAGEASLEAVRKIAKMLKERGVREDLLDTWMALPLRVHEDEAMAAKLATKVKNKKAKKSQQEKDMLEIEKELKEGDAALDKLDLAKNQADILHSVTLSYFRVLKDCGGDGGSKGKGKELLPVCLRGLAKFSHLIHLDAISDLMSVLKELLKESHNLPLEAAIHCILCALKTLKGPGRDAIPIDPKEYLIPLYNELLRLGVYDYQNTVDPSMNEYNPDHNSGSNMEKSIEAAIQCLDHAFTQRRELSASRLTAFLKRITSTSMHCPPHSSTPLIASARQMALRYSSLSKVQNMLENEEEIVAEGMYAPDAQDPEHSNAHATSLWELSLLKFHIHPSVTDHATAMAENKFLKLPGEAPLSIGKEMGRNAQEGYILHKPTVKKHPLDCGEGKRKRQRRNQEKARFITPRKTGQWHLLEPNCVSLL